CWRWGGDCWRLWWCWHWRDGCWRICRRSGWLRGTALLNSQRHHASERNGRSNPMHTLKLSMALLLRRVCSCACFVQEAVQNLVLVAAPQPSPQLVLDLRDWRAAVVVFQFLQALVVGHGLRGRFMRHCAPSARHSPPAADAAYVFQSRCQRYRNRNTRHRVSGCKTSRPRLQSLRPSGKRPRAASIEYFV